MFSESFLTNRARRRALGAVAALFIFSSGCGHKEPPFPPPLRHPATTKDLVVQQRGKELILSFGYPQTTVSGTPLEPLQIVEYWLVDRAVPQWVPPAFETEEVPDEDKGEATSEDTSADGTPTGRTEVTLFEGIAGSGDDPSLPDTRAAEGVRVADLSEEAAVETGADITGDDLDSETDPEQHETADEETSSTPPVPPTKEKLLEIDGRQFTATASLRTTLEGPALSAATFGDKIVLALPIDTPPEEAVNKKIDQAQKEDSSETGQEDSVAELEYGTAFAIKTGVSQKLISTFSNVVVIGRRTAPEPPETFSLEPASDRVTIRWPVDNDELVGFHVYRRDAQSPTYGPPLAFVPLVDPLKTISADSEDDEPLAEGLEEEDAEEAREREYSDRTALYGQRYIYAVTAVSNRGPVVESAITIEREVDYADRFAPGTPQGLIALAEAGRVRLLWNVNLESDVAGYIVLRSERGAEFEPLYGEPINELEYSDRQIRSGQTYSYRVIAVDETGNESGPSQDVDVRAP
jgi:hypothetical protein